MLGNKTEVNIVLEWCAEESIGWKKKLFRSLQTDLGSTPLTIFLIQKPTTLVSNKKAVAKIWIFLVQPELV